MHDLGQLWAAVEENAESASEIWEALRLRGTLTRPVFVEPVGRERTHQAKTRHQYRRSASYVDRILRGGKPANYPRKHRLSMNWPSTLEPPKDWV